MIDGAQFAQMPDGREIAFRVTSDNPGPLILHTPSGPFPVDLLDEDPMYDRFLRTLGTAGRLVAFDKPSIGSSDPVDRERSFFDQFAEACVGVMDACGERTAWIVGSTLSAIVAAVRQHPTRFEGTVLVNPISPDQFRENIDSAVDRIRDPQRLNLINPSRSDDPAFHQWRQRASRLGSSAIEKEALMRANERAHMEFWAEDEPITGLPPTMLIRRRDAMPASYLQQWLYRLPDAECVTIEGADACEMALDAGLVAELAVGFITGEPVDVRPQRELVALLFTDLVESTPNVVASGDSVWRSMLDRYEATLRRTIQRYHGTVVKHTGDGALATFPSPSEAIDAAIDLHNSTRDLKLEGRTGIHVGEVERRDDDIGGIAVHLAARIMGQAEPGEIIVTSTVAESAMGGAHRFNNRGSRVLKGIDQPWEIFAVT